MSFLLFAAGDAGDLQSPTMPATPAAHAANASETEGSPRTRPGRNEDDGRVRNASRTGRSALLRSP
jgi:hypothetical protein